MTNTINNDIINSRLVGNLIGSEVWKTEMSIDIDKKQREFKQLNLSDSNVVKYLILYRSKIDVTYGANSNTNIHQAGDIFDFNVEIITMYASLDELIEICKFKEKQRTLLKLIFEGNTIQDICRMNIGYKKSATYDLFDRMILRIVEMNYIKWKECMRIQGYIKEESGEIEQLPNERVE